MQLGYAARDAWLGYAAFDVLGGISPEVLEHAADVVADELSVEQLESDATERRHAKRALRALDDDVEAGRRTLADVADDRATLRRVVKETAPRDSRLDLDDLESFFCGG